MWPHRPWLFQGQNRPQGSSRSGSQESSQSPPQYQSTVLPSSQTQFQIHNQPQTVSRPRPQYQFPQRDWLRRYQPSINSRVYGYPSTGGVLILPGYHIDLPFLGLDRNTQTIRSGNQMEEDMFCRRLRYLGASWWAYPDADFDALKGQSTPQDLERALTHTCVGWLANGAGVWVLKYNESDDDNEDLSLRAQRIGALNMHDRCRLIEELGGVFYRHPEECPDLRWNNWPMLR